MAAAGLPTATTATPAPPRLVATRSDLGNRVAPQLSSEYDRRPSRSSKPSIGGQSVAALLREAKALTLDLRTAIKRKDPWDREVEFQRESVRKAYSRVLFSSTVGTSSSIALLAASSSNPVSGPSNALGSTTSLVSPSASHSTRLLEALNSLWLETSHSIIKAYRSRISAMDKTLAEAPQPHRKGGGGAARGEPPPPGPTARRKLVHSFRTFLAKEEEYFTTLLGRLASDLSPNDLEGFNALGVVVEPVESWRASPRHRKRTSAEPDQRPCHSQGAGGRRGNKSKVTSAGGSERNKPKNYSRASACYTQARLLIPENGNPSNQLAVISGYTHDTLSSTYHYFRALSLAFNKAVTRWFERPSGWREPTPDFVTAFIALHGLLFTKTRWVERSGRAQPRTRRLTARGVSARRLSDIAPLSSKVENTIIKIVVTGLCSLWDARVHRSSSNPRKTPSKRSAEAGSNANSAPSVNINLEPHILLHVLSMYTILLRICTNETAEAYLADTTKQAPKPGLNLAQNISAVVRRALPVLRVLSKWLSGQLDYIHRVESRLRAKEIKINRAKAADSATQASQADTTQRSSSVSDGQHVESSQDQSMETDHVNSRSLEDALTAFWTSYADFANSFKLVFPTEGLPSPADDGLWLEEDVDLLGFAPLRRSMKDVKGRIWLLSVQSGEGGASQRGAPNAHCRVAERCGADRRIREDEVEEEDEEDEAAPIPASSPTKALSRGVDSLDLFEQADEGSEPTEDDPMQDITDEEDDDEDDDDGHIVYRSRLNLGNIGTATRTPPSAGISPRMGTPVSNSAASSKAKFDGSEIALGSSTGRFSCSGSAPRSPTTTPKFTEFVRSVAQHDSSRCLLRTYAVTCRRRIDLSIWAPTLNESGHSSPSLLQRQGSFAAPSPLGLFGPASPFPPPGGGPVVPRHSNYHPASSTPYDSGSFNPLPYHAPPLFPYSNTTFGPVPTGSQSDLSPSPSHSSAVALVSHLRVSFGS
ncbi:BQ5605_C024g09944 [Microbotryum silenes-dioicae]|uniref:BQ5605_C024g09944 protein n=1 Tax=Microbotryum silenes-dioicae TaxID=796604 RepID=A0A2X0MPU6_9BASI|nr:BQ5605_C024g09944 [Microbotryum silenes-dioicae]